jgi:phage terminase large subunit
MSELELPEDTSTPNDDGTGVIGVPDWYPKAVCCWCTKSLVKAIIFDTECWVCPTPACHERQLRHAIVGTTKGTHGKKPTKKLLYLPLPKQTEAHEAVWSQICRRICYGGAAGGGKSKFLRWLAYQLCLAKKDFNVLLLRRSWPELEKTHIREAIREAPHIRARCIPSARKVEFLDTGSTLQFGHCQDDKDMNDYLSTEYDLILFDELVTFTEPQYLLISSRARTSRPDWKPMVVAGTNPGGPGSAWVTELFINKNRDRKKYPAYDPIQHHFIRAVLDDNPYLDADYVQFLMDLPVELREAYRWGRWDIFPGQYFKEFRREIHVKSIDIPTGTPRIGGMDWGYLRPGVFLWAVVLPDGRLYIEREYVFQETVAAEVARHVRATNIVLNINLASAACDPNMRIREGQTGEHTIETLRNNGLFVTPSINDRIAGWQRLRHWLKKAPQTGLPSLVISPDCEYLIRTLPQLCQDATKLEDVDTDSEDHAADALRYLVMSRPHPLTYEDVKVFDPDSAGFMLQQLLSEQNHHVLGQYNYKPS